MAHRNGSGIVFGIIFSTAANAVVPIVLLIGLGYFLKQKNVINDSFVQMGNKIVFRVFLPVMLFLNVYNIPGFSSISWDVVIYCIIAELMLFAFGFLVAAFATNVTGRKGVVMQCVFRSNFAIIGLPLSEALAGPEGAGVAAVISAFVIPLINILAVIALSIFDKEDGKVDVRSLVKNIVHNPLIIGVGLGLLTLGLRQMQGAFHVDISLKKLLPPVFTTLQFLKNMTTPLALIVLGGGFVFSAVRGLFKEIAVCTVVRLVLAPAMGIGAAYLLSRYTGLLTCQNAQYAALIALFGSPVAVSSAVMAREMHGDYQLATQLVVFTSICSMPTIFLLVCVVMGAGLL